MAPKRPGRPSSYTHAIAIEICTRLSDGEPLTRICKSDNMPARRTILAWLFRDESSEFQRMYARAREAQAEIMAEEIISIADDASDDFQEDSEGNIRVNNEAINRSRLRVDARKWIAAKLLPRRYGEHSSKAITIEPGANYVALLEALDGKIIDVTPQTSAE